MSKTVVAIIPARGGSTGIKRKNLVDVAGKPLVAHTVNHSLGCHLIDRTIVSSEDEEIRAVAQRYGAETMDRHSDFIHDNTIQEVDRLLIWTVEQIESDGAKVDIVVLLYPTSPLRQIATIERAVSMVLNDGYDSVLSLVEDSTYLWRREGDEVEPTNYDPQTRGPRQKESWNQWAENKAVYVMTRDLLMQTGCRLGGRVGCVEMPKLRSIDLDTPDDLALVRAIMGLQLPE